MRIIGTPAFAEAAVFSVTVLQIHGLSEGTVLDFIVLGRIPATEFYLTFDQIVAFGVLAAWLLALRSLWPKARGSLRRLRNAGSAPAASLESA